MVTTSDRFYKERKPGGGSSAISLDEVERLHGEAKDIVRDANAPCVCQRLARLHRLVRLAPVRAVREWRQVAGLESGPLFRSVIRGGEAGDGCDGQGVGGICGPLASRRPLCDRRRDGECERASHPRAAGSQEPAGLEKVHLRRLPLPRTLSQKSDCDSDSLPPHSP